LNVQIGSNKKKNPDFSCKTEHSEKFSKETTRTYFSPFLAQVADTIPYKHNNQPQIKPRRFNLGTLKNKRSRSNRGHNQAEADNMVWNGDRETKTKIIRKTMLI
jgi:hypothetical protein